MAAKATYYEGDGRPADPRQRARSNDAGAARAAALRRRPAVASASRRANTMAGTTKRRWLNCEYTERHAQALSARSPAYSLWSAGLASQSVASRCRASCRHARRFWTGPLLAASPSAVAGCLALVIRTRHATVQLVSARVPSPSRRARPRELSAPRPRARCSDRSDSQRDRAAAG